MNIRMNRPAAAVSLSVISLFFSVPAQAVLIAPTQDVSVLGGTRANQNNATNTYLGGLFSGVDGKYSANNASDAPARFYLMFTLPTLDPGISVLSAKLSGYYNESYSQLNQLPFDHSLHHLYLANSENWDSNTVTWNTQPGLSAAPIGSFMPDTNTGWRSWNITQAVREKYATGNTISIGFSADNEKVNANNNDWVFFISNEFDPNRAFSLDLELGKKVISAPEPSTQPFGMGMLICGGLVYHRRRIASASYGCPTPESAV